MQKRIKATLFAHLSVAEALANDRTLIDKIESAATQCIHSLKRGGRILLCGNGGSASDAQHIAAELSGRYLKERDPLDAEALHVNSSYLTAVANDYDFGHVYKRAVQAKGRPGDVLIAISTSGNSDNILEAVRQAKLMQLFTIGMTGDKGGQMKDLADMCLCMPSDHTPHIQEAHIVVGHILCELIESNMFP